MPRRNTPDPLALAVGHRVRRLREEAGLSLNDVADAGPTVAKSYLSDLERGLVVPTVASLREIASRIGVHELDFLVDVEGTVRERLVARTRRLSPSDTRWLLRELEQRLASREGVRGRKR